MLTAVVPGVAREEVKWLPSPRAWGWPGIGAGGFQKQRWRWQLTQRSVPSTVVGFERQKTVPIQQEFPLAFHLAVLSAVPPWPWVWGRRVFPLSVGPTNFSVRHYSSQKELINTQVAPSFAERFGGKSNTSVKTVSFVKVGHNRLAVSNYRSLTVLCSFIIQLDSEVSCFRILLFCVVRRASTALSVPLLFLPSLTANEACGWVTEGVNTEERGWLKAVTCECGHFLSISLRWCVALRVCTPPSIQ